MTEKETLMAAMEVAKAVFAIIKAADGEGMPSGELYAMLMDKMSINTYNSLIGLLKRSGLVTETAHLLRAVDVEK